MATRLGLLGGSIRHAFLPRSCQSRPSSALPMLVLSRAIASSTSNKSSVQSISKPLTPVEQNDILARQRRNRPVSPHLAIYRPQVHSIASALQRNTGLLLSGGIYIFGITYALNSLLPFFSGDVTAGTVALAATLGGLGWGAVGWLGKGIVAWTGSFHTINGILGLVRGSVSPEWAVGPKERFVKVGWWVMGLSVLGGLGLCLAF